MEINRLKEILLENQYSLIAYKENDLYTSNGSGIAPVLSKVSEQLEYFKDYIVIDKIIGKAAAMLFARSKVKYLYALTLSQSGKEILEKYQIPFSYDTLVDVIVNRQGDGICPMEMTVKDIEDLDEARNQLINKVQELRNMK